MSIWACYLIALFPMLVAAFLWIFSKKVVIWETLGITAVGFLTAIIFQCFATSGMMDDVETWSGRVTTAMNYTPWKEAYDKEIYRDEVYYTYEDEYKTDSKGNRKKTGNKKKVKHTREVFDHLEARTRWHSESWSAQDTLTGSYGIDQTRYTDILKKFGGVTQPVKGDRSTWGIRERNSRMIEGDQNDYQVINKTNFVYPVNATKKWENKIKACPSVFSFEPVPEKMEVIPYPDNFDKFSSGRLVGQTGVLKLEEWDRMNAELNPHKKVNVIAVGFGPGSGEMAAEHLQAKWVGGKKNDLVIAFGGGTSQNAPTWVKVFGWTNRELVKQNLQSLILKKGINNEILPEIKAEIEKNYEIKNWRDFDYLTVEIPFSRWMWLLVTMAITTGGAIAFSLFNPLDKEDARKNKRDSYNY